MRLQPGTAKGVVFLTMEDETGVVNVIVWRDVHVRCREALVRSQLLAVYGVWQRQGDVAHLVASRIEGLASLLGGLSTASRDFLCTPRSLDLSFGDQLAPQITSRYWLYICTVQ